MLGLWKSLPQDVIQVKSLAGFKNRIELDDKNIKSYYHRERIKKKPNKQNEEFGKGYKASCFRAQNKL